MAVLGTILGLCVVLPINYTVKCQTDDIVDSSKCDKNITDFGKTTISNIPEMGEETTNWKKIFELNHIYGRLYTIVAVSWIMILYCIRVLDKEWVNALALRSVFYHEGKHFENRKRELEETIWKDETEEEEVFVRRMINKGLDRLDSEQSNEYHIPLNIPHPEQRETIPNIGLYSVLVGNIPVPPENHKDKTGWQLRVGVSKKCTSYIPILIISLITQI